MIDWSTYFTYDSVSGQLIWKRRPSELFNSTTRANSWNTRFSGKAAGCSTSRSRRVNVMIGGKLYAAHRVIWEMVHGPIPQGKIIDHVNGDYLDNRLHNLRLATTSENNANCRAHSKQPFGYMGVSYSSRSKKWLVVISIKGKSKRVGEFKCIHEAAEAYNAAATARSGPFARVNRIQRPSNSGGSSVGRALV